MIDLSTCVSGQKVRFANGKIGEVLLGIGWSGHPNMLRVTYNNERWWCCTLDGIPNSNICSAGWEIVEILPLETPEEKPMIDLSTCVPDQKVRFANGKTGEVGASTSQFGLVKVRTIQANDFGWCWYTLDGKDTDELGPEWQIVEILPLEIPEEEPVPTPQEMDYKKAYIEIANIISVAFPECEVAATDMARLLIHENRTLRMALGLPSYKQVSDAIDDEEVE